MKDDNQIRFIFRERRNFSRAAAAEAFGRSIRWIEKMRFLRENGDVVEWEELVLLADLIWTHSQIHRALGDEARQVFPTLQLLSPMTVYLQGSK